MNKKVLFVLCVVLSALTVILPSCGKKNDNVKDKNAIKLDTVWDNISDYGISSSKELEILAQGDHKKLVGGAYDGERYAYYVLSSDNMTGVICKYDTKDKSLKRTSDELDISGINGICCNKNTLVILYGEKNICVINNSSFEEISRSNLIFEGVGIAYNKKHDRYVLLMKNGGISVMNSQFEHVLSISQIEMDDSKATVTCNSRYIITLTADENGSDIVIYDWDGNYVSTASVTDVNLTPVSIYTDDDAFFIGYENENGGVIYKTMATER